MAEKLDDFNCGVDELARTTNLVEAGAGTGKTYAIAMLVLRFVVECGIDLSRILVVTFTRAATNELRGRIRSRLLHGRALLQKQIPAEDPTMARWAETVTDPDAAVKRLDLAILEMDTAPIFTIHGFCGRMLSDQVLESGCLFDHELTADVSQVKTEVAQDYWRTTLSNLNRLHCSLLLDRYANPESLLKSISGTGIAIKRIEPQLGDLEQQLSCFDRELEMVARWWRECRDLLHTHFRDSIEAGLFKADFSREFADWWQAVDRFLGSSEPPVPEGLEHLSREGILVVLNGRHLRGNKKREHVAHWPLSDDGIDELLRCVQNVVICIRRQLAGDLDEEVSRRLAAMNRMGFDGLIRALGGALASAHGAGLRSQLSDRFEAALIDEFQDTDGVQYEIFSTLFNDKKHYLYLIGDPKQAVYKFRGADIFAYFKAKKEAARHLGLLANYRSHPKLVEAVNRLFSRKDNPFVFEQLPYHPVRSAASAETCLMAGDRQEDVLCFCQLAENEKDKKKGRWTSAVAAEQIRDAVVRECVRLLGGDDRFTVTGSESGPKRVKPADIAILVRSHKQGESFGEALREVNIPATLTGRRTIFDTEECRELFRILKAAAEPGDSRLLKAALTTELTGLNGEQLRLLWEDEKGLAALVERFHEYCQLWQEEGVQAMMRKLLRREGVEENCAGLTGGERRLTNLLHLIEVLGDAEVEQQMGPLQTLGWLQEEMTKLALSGEELELRLESEGEAVHIVTMHAAKGLEFPVVFCPFLWYRSNRLANEKDFIVCHDEDARPLLDLGSEKMEEHRRQALFEELAEDLRLAYVAVTRAKYRCLVYWADVKKNSFVADSFDSALGDLLQMRKEMSFSEQQQLLEDLAAAEGSSYHLIEPALEEQVVALLPDRQEEGLVPQTRTIPPFRNEWLMTSYSALAALSKNDEAADEIDTTVETPSANEIDGLEETVCELPRGADFGNVVHTLLEDLPFATLASSTEDYEEKLAMTCQRFGSEPDHENLRVLLNRVVNSPLAEGGGQETFCLADLDEKDCLAEMAFYLKLTSGSTAVFNRILGNLPVVAPLAEKRIGGYLTGFIDLICRHQGRYYVIDYKSNHLGDCYKNYQNNDLVMAMEHHNYGLQYWIYSLVLHRYLGDMLDDYDYDRCFGGVFYLFVRGMGPQLGANGIYYDRPQLQLLDELMNCLAEAGDE